MAQGRGKVCTRSRICPKGWAVWVAWKVQCCYQAMSKLIIIIMLQYTSVLYVVSYNEPSALEGLFRGFFPSPLSFLKSQSSVDWSSWRSERHGRSFMRIPKRKRLLSRSLLFQPLFWSFRPGFNSATLLVPGAGARSACFSCLVSRETCADLGTCPEGKRFSFGLRIFESTFWFCLNMFPDVCLASPRIGADTGVPSCE